MTSGDHAALGVALRDVGALRALVVRLHSTGGTIGIHAPAWLAAQIARDAGAMLGAATSVTSPVVEKFFAALTGDCHCVATFDDGGCVAFRGPTASQALFYAVDGESLFVASRISAIRAVRAAAVDLTGLAPFLVPAMCVPTGTSWQGICRLPPGHLLTWSAGKVEVAEVAHITPVDSTGATTKDLTHEFRSRLTTAVRRSSAPPDGLLLSGGIDSSSLACAYAFDQHLTSQARAYALTYDSQLAACDERRFLDDVERVTGMPVHRLAGNRLLPLVSGYPEDDEPEPWPYASRNWALLRHTAADIESRTATLLAGEGGDELLLGQVFSVADRIARGDTTGGADELRTFPDATAAGRVVDALLAGSYDTPGCSSGSWSAASTGSTS